MYFNPRIKEDHTRRLQAAQWHYREVYVAREGTWHEFSEQVSFALSFPGYYGKNLNALNDCLKDIEFPENGKLALGFERFDIFAKKEPDTAHDVLDIFASQERSHLLAGRRLLFLLRSGDPRLYFDPVGAQVVMWSFEEWLDSKRQLGLE